MSDTTVPELKTLPHTFTPNQPPSTGLVPQPPNGQIARADVTKRPDPRGWLKEAEADIKARRRDLDHDQKAIETTKTETADKIAKLKADSEAKIAELEARCSEHRIDIRVHEARAEGARRGIAALDAKPRGRKAADG